MVNILIFTVFYHFSYESFLTGVYEFHPKYWDKVSEEAKDLIRKLLVIDPLNRLTVEQVCRNFDVKVTNVVLSMSLFLRLAFLYV